jgi:hypothetical protein
MSNVQKRLKQCSVIEATNRRLTSTNRQLTSRNNQLQTRVEQLNTRYNQLERLYKSLLNTDKSTALPEEVYRKLSKNLNDEVFTSLQNQYFNQLEHIKTQEGLLQRQSNLINKNEETINQQNEILTNTTNTVHTKRRELSYDEKDEELKKQLIYLLKISILILGLIMATVVYKKMQ